MKLIFLIITFIISSFLYPQVGKIYPVDESSGDSIFKKFYIELQKVVSNEDIKSLENYLADSLYVPGEGSGFVSKKEFLLYYKENNYKALWDNFNSVFTIGGGRFRETGEGAAKKKYFYAPYTSIDLLEDRDDLLEPGMYSSVIVDFAKVYEKKSVLSKIIATLNYDIVKNNFDANNFKDSKEWSPIKLKNGKAGYLKTKYLRDLFDVKCGIVLQGTNWKVEYIDAFE